MRDSRSSGSYAFTPQMHSVRGQPCLPPVVSVRVCSDMASDASCTLSPGPSLRTGQDTDIISALFQEEKYELASNGKICHLELSFSSVGWPVLVNAVGQQYSISPVFLSGELSPFGNFFQDACGNWNCNNMKIKSSCPCPALLLTGKPHWLFQSLFFFFLFQSLIMATSDAKMYGYTSASWFLGFKQCLWISKVKNLKFNSLVPSSFLTPSSWFLLVAFFNDWFLLKLLL